MQLTQENESLVKLVDSPDFPRFASVIREWIAARGEEQGWFRKRREMLSKPGYIYLVEAIDSNGIFKVGMSQDPVRRLAQLPTKAPYDLRLHSIYEADSMLWSERMLHRLFGSSLTLGYQHDNDGYATGEYASRRLNGEWFQGLLIPYRHEDEFPDSVDQSRYIPDQNAIPIGMGLVVDGCPPYLSLKSVIGENIEGFIRTSMSSHVTRREDHPKPLRTDSEGRPMPPWLGKLCPMDYWHYAVMIDSLS